MYGYTGLSGEMARGEREEYLTPPPDCERILPYGWKPQEVKDLLYTSLPPGTVLFAPNGIYISDRWSGGSGQGPHHRYHRFQMLWPLDPFELAFRVKVAHHLSVSKKTALLRPLLQYRLPKPTAQYIKNLLETLESPAGGG